MAFPVSRMAARPSAAAGRSRADSARRFSEEDSIVRAVWRYARLASGDGAAAGAQATSREAFSDEEAILPPAASTRGRTEISRRSATASSARRVSEDEE